MPHAAEIDAKKLTSLRQTVIMCRVDFSFIFFFCTAQAERQPTSTFFIPFFFNSKVVAG